MFIKEVTRGTTSIGGTSGTVAFNNNGTVNIKSGVLNFRNRFTQTAGSTLLSGGGLAAANPLLVQGGMLGGNGNIAGAVSLSGGQLNPGLTVAGFLRETGDYTQNGSGALVVQLNGLTPGTQYDRLAVNGAVHLGGSLRVSAGFRPAVGTQFIIIANDGTDAVTGTFSGLPQGATITTPNGVRCHITYNGGDGNDVVLSSL
ncbi:MAG: hypothetical protein JOZ57_12540 [Abitibacteriaceae bacterium]|nr:hypothetical protein [Abditibacteriaceae bacterium]